MSQYYQKINRSKFTGVVFFLLSTVLFTTSAAWAEESVVTDTTEEFLSDRSRVGSIVGSILAGAALANPFAPLAGTIVGFFVGKSTDFSEEKEAKSNYYARQSFAPAAGSAGTTKTLSLNFGGPEADVPVTAGANAEDESEGAIGPEQSGSPQASEVAIAAASDEIKAEPGAEPLLTEPDNVETDNGGTDIAETDTAETEPELRSPPAVNLIISKDVGGRQAELDRLAAIIRAERNGTPFELNQQCPNQEASRIRKKVVVAGFNVENPDQAVFGGLGSVGYGASERLYQNLLNTGEVLPLSAPGRQMFASLRAGPTRETSRNQLDQYSAVSRQMGAQFVVSGIIRNLDVNRAESWDSSYASSIKRSLFSADTVREFVVDVVLHDGYTGQVVSEQRYTAAGRWDIPRTGKVGFGSPEFNDSDYGVAVAEVFEDITDDLMSTIDCQALLVPILEVTGKDLLLDVGTKSGLLPGDKLRVVRAEWSLQRPNAPPKLWDTGVDLHMHQLSLDTSRAWMPADGSTINIREGDYAVMY